MKIILAKSAGFCFGVKRALDIAFDTAKSDAEVYMLGDIVHNEEVVKEIIAAGIKKIEKLFNGQGKTLLIRAHGEPLKIIKRAKILKYTVVDATCPMVKEIHKIVKEMEQNGFKIIVIGDEKHDEVRGIIGQLEKKAIVIDSLEDIPLRVIKKINKAAVVAQSTQNFEMVIRIVNVLKRYIKELKFYNTICKPTRIKQGEIKTMPLKNDVMIVIGSKNSANTKRLYEISKSLNTRTHWLQSKKEILPKWFRNAKCVGITAGASTPDATTDNIIKYIKQIKQ